MIPKNDVTCTLRKDCAASQLVEQVQLSHLGGETVPFNTWEQNSNKLRSEKIRNKTEL